ncbi:MAG: hypothetical protein G3W60_22150, partial [Xanthomonas perforans]|nr:hypothetical protein [Xanthomonas perforans]
RQFVQKIISCDTAFRDDKGSDYVFAGVWGKAADGKVYLIDYRRERLSFTRTAEAIMALKANNPGTTKVYIEQASNGHAII